MKTAAPSNGPAPQNNLLKFLGTIRSPLAKSYIAKLDSQVNPEHIATLSALGISGTEFIVINHLTSPDSIPGTIEQLYQSRHHIKTLASLGFFSRDIARMLSDSTHNVKHILQQITKPENINRLEILTASKLTKQSYEGKEIYGLGFAHEDLSFILSSSKDQLIKTLEDILSPLTLEYLNAFVAKKNIIVSINGQPTKGLGFTSVEFKAIFSRCKSSIRDSLERLSHPDTWNTITALLAPKIVMTTIKGRSYQGLEFSTKDIAEILDTAIKSQIANFKGIVPLIYWQGTAFLTTPTNKQSLINGVMKNGLGFTPRLLAHMLHRAGDNAGISIGVLLTNIDRLSILLSPHSVETIVDEEIVHGLNCTPTELSRIVYSSGPNAHSVLSQLLSIDTWKNVRVLFSEAEVEVSVEKKILYGLGLTSKILATILAKSGGYYTNNGEVKSRIINNLISERTWPKIHRLLSPTSRYIFGGGKWARGLGFTGIGMETLLSCDLKVINDTLVLITEPIRWDRIDVLFTSNTSLTNIHGKETQGLGFTEQHMLKSLKKNITFFKVICPLLGKNWHDLCKLLLPRTISQNGKQIEIFDIIPDDVLNCMCKVNVTCILLVSCVSLFRKKEAILQHESLKTQPTEAKSYQVNPQIPHQTNSNFSYINTEIDTNHPNTAIAPKAKDSTVGYSSDFWSVTPAPLSTSPLPLRTKEEKAIVKAKAARDLTREKHVKYGIYKTEAETKEEQEERINPLKRIREEEQRSIKARELVETETKAKKQRLDTQLEPAQEEHTKNKKPSTVQSRENKPSYPRRRELPTRSTKGHPLTPETINKNKVHNEIKSNIKTLEVKLTQIIGAEKERLVQNEKTRRQKMLRVEEDKVFKNTVSENLQLTQRCIQKANPMFRQKEKVNEKKPYLFEIVDNRYCEPIQSPKTSSESGSTIQHQNTDINSGQVFSGQSRDPRTPYQNTSKSAGIERMDCRIIEGSNFQEQTSSRFQFPRKLNNVFQSSTFYEIEAKQPSVRRVTAKDRVSYPPSSF